jgi:arylformamidase
MADSTAWLDVTLVIEPQMVSWPGDPPVSLHRLASLASGDAVNLSAFSASLHCGTHVDAPAHYLPGGAGIDGMPPEAMIGLAKVFSVVAAGAIEVADLEGLAIVPGDRILLRTGNSLLYAQKRFDPSFVGLTEGAAGWLAARQIRTLGVDYLSVAGMHADQAAVHRRLLEAGIWLIEGLNLAAVAPGRYQLYCLPLRISDAEAAPARVLLRPLGRQHTSAS